MLRSVSGDSRRRKTRSSSARNGGEATALSNVVASDAVARARSSAVLRCRRASWMSAVASADLADGTAYGITGTPTIFVNGVKVRRLSAEDFRDAIDNALKGQTTAASRAVRH